MMISNRIFWHSKTIEEDTKDVRSLIGGFSRLSMPRCWNFGPHEYLTAV